MNFFSGYDKAKKNTGKYKMLIGALAPVIALGLAFGAVHLISMRVLWDRNVAELEQELQGLQHLRVELDAARAKVNATEKVFDALNVVDSTLNQVIFFSSDDAYRIINAVPEGVTIGSFVVEPPFVYLAGGLDSMATLPSLMQNLENTGIFLAVTPTNAALNTLTPEGHDIPLELILSPGSIGGGAAPGYSPAMQGEENVFAITCVMKGVPLI